MRDNSKCITISLTTSTWSHCFVDIEASLGSVYMLGFFSVIAAENGIFVLGYCAKLILQFTYR